MKTGPKKTRLFLTSHKTGNSFAGKLTLRKISHTPRAMGLWSPSTLFFLFGLFLATTPSHAYDYPYADPFYATISAGLLKANSKDKSVRPQNFDIEGRDDRNAVPYFGSKRNYVSLRFWEAKPGSPLILLLSGLGGSAQATYQNFLAYHFVKRGFHVLSLPSAYHFQFALSRSQLGTPGWTKQDAKDLYDLAVRATERIQQKKQYRFPAVGLVGVSMGALHAPFVDLVDQERNHFSFQRVLLINPPVNPLYGGMVLDSLLDAGKILDSEQKKSLKERLYEFGIQSILLGDIENPAYFLDFENRFPTTEVERKYVIGKSLSEFLEALVFTTQQVFDLGVLKNPPATDDPNPRLAEASDFRYFDYLEKILLPSLRRQGNPKLTQEELLFESSFASIADSLKSNPRLFVMHNADDFLLRPEDIETLKSIFHERLTLYPRGGHVGNIWFPENLEKILSTFESLKVEQRKIDPR